MTATQIYCYNVKAALDDMQVNLDENCRWLPRNTSAKSPLEVNTEKLQLPYKNKLHSLLNSKKIFSIYLQIIYIYYIRFYIIYIHACTHIYVYVCVYYISYSMLF